MDTYHKWTVTKHATNPRVFFPRLRHLTLYHPLNVRFLEVHGHKITTISLVDPRVLIDCQQYLPNLRDVIVKTEHIYHEFPEYSQQKKVAAHQVKRVGISVEIEQFSCKFFNQAVVDLPLYFPNMECLRILDKRTISYLMQPRPMKRWQWHIRSVNRKYRLEREDGELLFSERDY